MDETLSGAHGSSLDTFRGPEPADQLIAQVAVMMNRKTINRYRIIQRPILGSKPIAKDNIAMHELECAL